MGTVSRATSFAFTASCGVFARIETEADPMWLQIARKTRNRRVAWLRVWVVFEPNRDQLKGSFRCQSRPYMPIQYR